VDGDRGKPAEHARLGAADVEDVRTLAADQPHELDEPRGVPPRIDRTADIPQWLKAGAGSLGGLAERTGPVRRDRHVEPRDERREQGRHVPLRPADLGQRDDQEDARPAPPTA
jgi:hypothetical protein